MADDVTGEAGKMANSVMNVVLPDLAVVKTDILNYYDNEFESTPISIQCDIKPILEEDMLSEPFREPDNYDYDLNEDNKFINCNKIILGSKPNRVCADQEDFEQRPTRPCQENDLYFPKSPKLDRVSVDENFFEELVTPYEPNVVLHDIKSYLLKSRRFCDTCNILFPDPQSYETHDERFHAERDSLLTITEISYENKVLVRHNQHKCTICAKYFATHHVLRQHIKNIHKSNNVKPVVKDLQETDTSNIQQDKSLDPSNTCFHCKKTFETQKNLIEHLYDILQMKRKKTEIVPVLKSILFKCNKCDIHFTSSQVAADHAEHMEMLINWKCSICYRIFKKEDELSHERQHSVSNNFVVYNLEEIDIAKILFRCSKCATHFDESNFLYHFRDCGLEVSKSMQCKICYLLLDNNLKTSHESVGHNKLDRFTIIETDVISDNPTDVQSTEESLQTTNNVRELNEPIREAKVVLQRIDSSKHNTHNMLDITQKKGTSPILDQFSSHAVEKETPKIIGEKNSGNQTTANATKKQKTSKQKTKVNDEINKTRPENIYSDSVPKRQKLTYLYCETCQCFITNFRTDVHKQAHCKNTSKTVCKYCGLVLTICSMKTHYRLHEKRKELKLNDYRFYNLYSGRAIHPPIPDYPKCTDCAVHFLSKTDINNHICSEEAYLTCHICQMKLSESAFKMHMAFHKYSKDFVKTSQSSNTSNTLKTFETDNAIELSHSLDMLDSPGHKLDEDMYEIIFTCGNCLVSVDTYDKVIEHCQGHYKDEERETPTQSCNYCNIKVDTTCYVNHHKLHEQGNEFKVLKFDSYYLPAENNMWVKHIFKTLPEQKVLNIISTSIYRPECRIKMDVVQQGDPKLTVYKCDQCSCFIEPGAIFKHADNSCFKLRQHPCNFCDLPFNSSASRIEHEKIHSRPGITVNSYRIVVFNREQDKRINRSLCLRKNYVLYKCRNCDVIIEKLHRYIHGCDNINTKKCPECALLLHNDDYDRHLEAHKELISFNYSNMKVITLGEAQMHNEKNANTSKSNFKGAIYDYKMFICRKCLICLKDEKYISKHSCHFGKQRSKCLKCGLYFSAGSLKTHSKAHDRDSDFIRSNMSIVSFDPCILDQNKNSTLQYTEVNQLSDSNTDSDSDIVMAANDEEKDVGSELTSMATERVIEETAKVYKCPCALHFLNEDSIFRHFGACRSKAKIAKQKCPKCDLVFTPNVLFTHLLAHHSNKSRRYKYDIVEMDNTQRNILHK